VRRGDEALRKYKTADYQTAKAALLDQLQFLDKVSSDPNISSDPNVPGEFRQDAMMMCARLSKLEEKNHGPEQAAYMKQAVARCQTFKLHVVKCDDDSLRREVDRLDALIK
jgi:hypothetical protein